MRQVKIEELKRGDFVYDMDGGYKIYSDAALVNGAWAVEATSTSEHVCRFVSTDIPWTHPPEGSFYANSKFHPHPTSRFLKE